MVLPSRPPPEDGPLPRSPAPPSPLPLPKTHCRRRLPVPKWTEANAQGPPLPAGCVSAARRPGGAAGRAGRSTRHSLPRRKRARRRGRRPGLGARRRRQRQSGVGRGGDWGGRRGAGCGDGVVPAADGVRTGEVGRGVSPHRASLARSRRRRHQHRRRHLHFCPSFSVSQARLPSGGGGANGGRRRREETGGRGVRLRGAGLRETGGKALAIGRLNVVGPRRCKARADWSVRPRAQPPVGAGWPPSASPREHVFGKGQAEGRARPRGGRAGRGGRARVRVRGGGEAPAPPLVPGAALIIFRALRGVFVVSRPSSAAIFKVET